MVSGSILGLTPKANELWALLAGLRCAFYEDENCIQLKTDNHEAVKEWEDWRWFLNPILTKVIQQLEQRKKDLNLTLEIKTMNESENRFAMYLAVDGAQKSRLLLFRRSFGRVRVRELWHLDMGLGPTQARFEIAVEDNSTDVKTDVVDEVNRDDVHWLVEEIVVYCQ